MANLPELPIHRMAQRHDGLTEALAETYTEAAGVCLDRHHRPPTEFDLHRGNGVQMAAVVKWQQAEERVQRAHGNDIEATEFGACACVLAAVELVDGLVAVGRADTGTGADYYIAPKGTTIEDLGSFEGSVRLEVSGMDRGSEGAVNQRLREKLKQASAGNNDSPAMAGVVGFEAKLIKLADVMPVIEPTEVA